MLYSKMVQPQHESGRIIRGQSWVAQDIVRTGVIPIVRLVDRTRAVEFVRALIKGAVPVSEDTLMKPDAIEAVRRVELNCRSSSVPAL